MTIGDYIRNRRLSLAGQELLHTKNKIIDVAMRYQYDTQESFSKAFTRILLANPTQKKQIKAHINGPQPPIKGIANCMSW
jgi:AraC-like DNA-binding protein